MVAITDKGVAEIHVVEHRGLGNAAPAKAVSAAEAQLVEQLIEKRDRIDRYLRWKQTVASRSMGERTAVAIIRPILVSTEEVLPSAWT
jgi:hypothetical protein